MWQSARRRARIHGIPFTLVPSDVSIPTTCPVLGIPLNRNNRGAQDSSPSLDRIEPALGYVPGNTLVVSWRANRLKGSSSPADLSLLNTFYKKYLK